MPLSNVIRLQAPAVSRNFGVSNSLVGMADDKPVALALVTQTQIDMLGTSLKVVFSIKDNADGFADLLRALDEADRLGGPPPPGR